MRGLFIGANIKKRKKNCRSISKSLSRLSLRNHRCGEIEEREREGEEKEEERLCETEPVFEKIREADPINEHWMMVLKLRFQRR